MQRHRSAAHAAATLLLVALPAAACTAGGDGSAPSPGAATPAGGVLVASTGEGDAAIDGSSGALVAGGHGAVAAPDGAGLYRTRFDGARTTLTTIDPISGVTVGTEHLRGRLDVSVASVSGRAVALVEPVRGAASGPPRRVAIPRAQTPIVVADPSGEADPLGFRLDGNYEPEAFSTDDERLFLLQYLPAEAPAVYRVTALDLATGDVRPVAGRFKSPPERMPGVRLAQTYDPVTRQMYTLYSNQPGAYADGYEAAGGAAHDWPEQTFVHVLNLRKGWAYCAGLPRAMWGGAAKEQAIAASPDGRRLYVVDSTRELVAVMDTRSLEVVGTVHVAIGPDAGARTSIAVSDDGARLFVASSAGDGAITAIETKSFTVAERWPAPWPISGIGLSLDGASLFAAGGGRISVLDLASGERLATMPAPGPEQIVGLDAIGPA
jgi:YVTN family beta-propeller protein